MKKTMLTLLAVFAALYLTGCSSSEREIFHQDSTAESATESGATTASSRPSEPQSRFEEEKSGIPDLDPAIRENNAETSAGINSDLIAELGMTFARLTEKYGEPHGTFNSYEFGSGAGYGRYVWRFDEGKIFDDMESAGGCNLIIGIDPEKLFFGLTYPMELGEFSDRYDLVPVSVDSEIGMDDCYWGEFTSPLYENVSFVFSTTTYGSIDENTKFSVRLNVDCLKAVPII